MGDQEKTCGELVGVKVNEMAVKCGGRQWALKTYGEHAETAIVVGEIISWQQGTRAAFDKYIVEWDDGDEEVVTLDQVRRIMQNNPGTAVTALPSSVRLLTAASCCSWNHLPMQLVSILDFSISFVFSRKAICMVIYSTGIYNPKVTTRGGAHPGPGRTRDGEHRILGRTRGVDPHPLLELLDRDSTQTVLN